jgi:hypothetical protein
LAMRLASKLLLETVIQRTISHLFRLPFANLAARR